MENNTARNFVLQLGSLVSLYLSLIFLLVLTFGVINLTFPDATDSVWQIEGAAEQVRLGIAMVIVFFPTYILLTKRVNTIRRTETKGLYLSLTKWLIYLSLLIGGLVLLIDLVVVIMTFLNGEITERFILKALAVLIVIGTAFNYYIKDAKRYWVDHEKKSKLYGLAVSVVVLAAVVLGFFNIQTPQEVRERKLDEQQVQDLQQLQWRIQDYLTLEDELPQTLTDLNTKGVIPQAPEGRPAYEYSLTESGFELCATFKTESLDNSFYPREVIPLERDTVILNLDDWQHREGRQCFTRKVSFAQQEN